MWTWLQKAYYWLHQNVVGFVLIEIVVTVWLCVKFVMFAFKVLRHFGIDLSR
jgi:hypothetical protein